MISDKDIQTELNQLQEQQDFERMRKAPSLDSCKLSSHPEVHYLAVEILENLGFSKRMRADKHGLKKKAINCIICNLIYAQASGKPLAVSRRWPSYSMDHSRYGKAFYSYRNIISIIDAMKDRSDPFLEFKPGIYRRHARFRSRIWSTDLLLKLFEKYQITPAMIEYHPITEVIRLRNHKKQLVGYEDTPQTDRMRGWLINRNELTEKVRVGLSLPENLKISDQEIIAIKSSIHSKALSLVKPGVSNRDLTSSPLPPSSSSLITGSTFEGVNWRITGSTFGVVRKDLHRVFNRDFDHGGRFYGSAHINLPEELRPLLTILGYDTSELDFEAMHIRMLYHGAKTDYPGDPYSGLCYGDKNIRKIYKRVAMLALNCKNEAEAISTLRWNMMNGDVPSHPNPEMFVVLFREEHKKIKNAFYQGDGGLKLQTIDARIMEAILDRLHREGIVALPVHDSMVVQKDAVEKAYQIMVEEYQRVLNTKLEPKIRITTRDDVIRERTT